MIKDFDGWNTRKKIINIELNNLPYQERDIWWCSVGINIGYEEDGDGIRAERPVVIIKGFSRELCWIIPLTSSNKDNPYYIKIGHAGDTQASAIISQMKPIDTKRLMNKIGIVEKEKFQQLKKAVKDLL